MIPKSEFDDLVTQSGGNMNVVEQKLGLPIDSLSSGNTVALEIRPNDFKNSSVPSGNEIGVNRQWIPGSILQVE